MTTDRQSRREELVGEMRKRSGNSFPVMYRALKGAAVATGSAHKMTRKAVFEQIEKVKAAAGTHIKK